MTEIVVEIPGVERGNILDVRTAVMIKSDKSPDILTLDNFFEIDQSNHNCIICETNDQDRIELKKSDQVFERESQEIAKITATLKQFRLALILILVIIGVSAVLVLFVIFK